jgi:1,4-dihydroxy-2-naphthoate octaprenyltransferase
MVGTGVVAHYGLVPAGKSLAALGVAVCLGFGLLGLIRTSSPAGPPGFPASVLWADRELPRSTVAWLAVALGLSIWLAATSSWWLLALGAVCVAAVAVVGRPLAQNRAIGWDQVGLLAAAELLATWGTVWVELGRLPWLGVVAAAFPASLAIALLLLAQMRDRSTDSAEGAVDLVAGLSEIRSRTLFQGLLVLALAVPLLITVPGLDGAECFLPWLLAPLAEGPLRNSRSADMALRERAVHQAALLLLTGSALLAVGIWTG